MRSGVHAGVKVIVELTLVTPSTSLTNSSICSDTWGPIGHPGRGEAEGDGNVALLHLDVVDQTQLDEVEAELGIDHVGEGFLDFVDGRHARTRVVASSAMPMLALVAVFIVLPLPSST